MRGEKNSQRYDQPGLRGVIAAGRVGLGRSNLQGESDADLQAGVRVAAYTSAEVAAELATDILEDQSRDNTFGK